MRWRNHRACRQPDRRGPGETRLIGEGDARKRQKRCDRTDRLRQLL